MRTITIGKYSFEVREESMADVYKAMDYTKRLLDDPEFDEGIRNVAADKHMLMLRVSGWSGPGLSDCTEQAKDRFFARRPNLLFELGSELRRLQEEDEKNSDPSQDG